MDIKKFFKNIFIMQIIGIPILLVIAFLVLFVFKIHSPLISELVFFMIVSIIAIVISFFVRRQYLEYIVIMMFSLLLSAFVEHIILRVDNSNCGALIFFIVYFITFLFCKFFEQYFNMPISERNFAAACQSLVFYLLSGCKNNKS